MTNRPPVLATVDRIADVFKVEATRASLLSIVEQARARQVDAERAGLPRDERLDAWCLATEQLLDPTYWASHAAVLAAEIRAGQAEREERAAATAADQRRRDHQHAATDAADRRVQHEHTHRRRL